MKTPDGITLDQAEGLAMQTDYAAACVGEPINVVDAGAFFFEGYNYALKQFKPKPQPEQPTPERIRSVIAQFHDLTDEQITMSCNRPEIVEPRQLAMTLIKIGLGKSLAFTGVELGNFDHATVLNAIKRVHERYTCYNHYRIMVDSLVAELFPSADQQQYITDRIIDPHKDRRNVLSKFTPQTA